MLPRNFDRAPRIYRESVLQTKQTPVPLTSKVSRKSIVEICTSVFESSEKLDLLLRSKSLEDLEAESALMDHVAISLRGQLMQRQKEAEEEAAMLAAESELNYSSRHKPNEPPSMIHSIALAEFDELQGNTLSIVHPLHAQPEIVSHTQSQIAELCLPDGGHRLSRDVSYLMLRAEDDTELFGVASFRNVPDKTQKRGARQFALLLIAKEPRFVLFETLLSLATDRFIKESESPKVLRDMYEILRSSSCLRTVAQRPDRAIMLWGTKVHPPRPVPRSGSITCNYEGVSVLRLVNMLGESTMVLWAFLVMERRVMFAGGDRTTAREVGQLCLATPLLVSPLCIKSPVPYVSLADTEPVTRKTHVCGATNSLFATKNEWFDLCFEPGKRGKSGVAHKISLAAAGELHKIGLISSSSSRNLAKQVPSQ